MNPHAKTREHKRYPREVDATPRARHCQADTENTTSRERIARPIYSAPRRTEWS